MATDLTAPLDPVTRKRLHVAVAISMMALVGVFFLGILTPLA